MTRHRFHGLGRGLLVIGVIAGGSLDAHLAWGGNGSGSALAEHTPLDHAWVLLCAALVFLMQAGFMCVEAGMARAKNSINVAIKNKADFLMAVAFYWVFGFGLMFGVSGSGWFGGSDWLVSGADPPWLAAFFVFQAMFAGTAATIDSGAIAGRMRFGKYLTISAVTSGLIYPVFGHWAWGGLYHGEAAAGWLQALGFHDFAGSTVVHSVGAWVALAALYFVGPRIDKFNPDGTANRIQPSNLPLVFLGVFLMFFGWFGFNGGNTLAVTAAVGRIIMVTMLSGVFAGLSCTACCWLLSQYRRPDPQYVANGVLAGLVAITASCDLVSARGAALIGLGAGAVCYFGQLFVERVLRQDDAVGAVAVHGFCGVFGTLAVAPFVPGVPFVEQLAVQAMGAAACFAWVFPTALAAMWIVRRVAGSLRVSEADERIGLNVAEHGASSSLLDLAVSMQRAMGAAEYTDELKVDIERGTEVGDLSECYNNLIDALQRAARDMRAANAALASLNEENQLLLDNVEQGLLTVDRDGVLSPARSTTIDEWFGVPAPDATMWSYLAATDGDFAEWFELAWDSVVSDILPVEMALDQLPSRLEHRGRHFSFEYTPIAGDGGLAKVLVLVSDRTDELAKRRLEDAQREIITVFELIDTDRSGFMQFFGDAGQLVELIAGREIPEADLLRAIHTLKGNCGLFGVHSMMQVCHDVESRAREAGEVAAADRRSIAEVWRGFGEKIASFIQTGDQLDVSEADYAQLQRAILDRLPHVDLARLVDSWRHRPTHEQLARMARQAKILATRLGKGDIEVAVDTGGMRLPAEPWGRLWSSLIHVVNNAIDHGLETPDERVAAGKPPVGRISLATFVDGDECVVEVGDDGRGVDWDRLADKARAAGLPHATRDELRAVLFADGVSTRGEVSLTSGRGVGMAAVHAVVEAMAGRIEIHSEPGQGTRFQFRIPRGDDAA